MQYKKFKDSIELSRLGMGNMRLPVKTNEPGNPIDYKKAKAMIDHAVREGINYFDTAYIYHAGESEVFVGKALAEYRRESYYVADKFNLQAQPDYKVQFAEQLTRLQMDYIDFYMLHGIQDHFVEEITTNGCIEYFDALKNEGKIRFLGFSFHGTQEALAKLLSIYDWDFVQIQLNYYDWQFEDAKVFYEMLKEADIPIMVMEPVHGGLLADMVPEANGLYKNSLPERSIASWAMRWVMELDQVQVVLSGMSNEEQLQDNINTFSEYKVLSQDEHKLVRKACKLQRKSIAVACTACRYCVPHCPQGLDIPRLLKAYNEAKVGGAWRLSSLIGLAPEKLPSACLSCGDCTKHCPQNINIPQYMEELTEMMKPFVK